MSDGKLGNQPHYARAGIEPIEAIEAWGLDFHLGSALKYIVRAGHKTGETREKDLTKALWYLRRRAAHRVPMDSTCGLIGDRYVSLDACLEAWKLPVELHACVTWVWRAVTNGQKADLGFAINHLCQEISLATKAG